MNKKLITNGINKEEIKSIPKCAILRFNPIVKGITIPNQNVKIKVKGSKPVESSLIPIEKTKETGFEGLEFT